MNRELFDTQPRTIAFPATALQMLAGVRDSEGATLRDGKRIVQTIVGHKDREDSEEVRAGEMGKTVIPITLSDGRLAVTGYWSLAALRFLRENKRTGARGFEEIAELSGKEMDALRVQPEARK